MAEPWPVLEPATPEEISAYHSITGIPPVSNLTHSQPKLCQLTPKVLSDAAQLWNQTPAQSEMLILEHEARHILTQSITIFPNKHAKYQKALGFAQDSKRHLIHALELYFIKTCALNGSSSRSITLENFEHELKAYLQLVLARYVGRSRVLLPAVEEIDPKFVDYIKPRPGPRTEKGKVLHVGLGCHVLHCARWVVRQEPNAIAKIWEVWEELAEKLAELCYYSHRMRSV